MSFIPAAPIRLLHVTSCCTVGGCEQHVLALLRRLDDQRYDRWLAYFEEQPDAADVMVEDFQAAGVRTLDLGANHRNDPGALWRLGALLRREQFDVVHTHSLRAEVAAAFWARFMPRPPILIRSMHNTDPLYDHPLLGRLGTWSAHNMDAFIAISDAVAGFAHAHLDLPPEAIDRIYYGLDLSEFTPPRRSDQPTFRLAIVARLAPQKGHRVLFEAMRLVLEEVPQARLIVIGHEDQVTIAELASYAERVGVSEAVEFMGFRADVKELLSAVDLFVLPSLWEGFGLVLLEAMALELPVVASAVGPIPEVVNDGTTGLLVPPGSPEKLAGAIVQLLRDPSRARTMGAAGRRRVEDSFNIAGMVPKIEAVYDRLLTHTAATQGAA